MKGVTPIPWREVTLGDNSSGKDQQQHAVTERSLVMYKSKRFE